MVSVLASSVVDRAFEPRSSQTKYYEISMCCFFDKNAPLRRKSKDWLAWNQDDVSGWGDMSIYGLVSMSQYCKKKSIKRVGLVQSGPHHHLIEKCFVLVII